MASYDINLNVCYICFNNFKQKQVYNIKQVLGNSKMGLHMKFSTYALITLKPEDNLHTNLHIEETENFNRIKTNCLVYDLVYDDINAGYFDKCFIYNDNSGKNGFYGYILYDTKTGKMNHVWNITKESMEICQRLKKTFLLFIHKEKYEPYIFA